MSIKIKNSKGEWVSSSATKVPIVDLGSHFKSPHVEGALRELAEKLKDNPDLKGLEIKVDTNTLALSKANSKLNVLEEDVEWLKEHGGGGGGGNVLPTITSTFTDCAIDKGSDISIPIFFTSPSGGNGTAFIVVNNIEVDSVGVKQGSNNIKVLGKYLNQTDNKVSIYVRDRAGIASNQLEWNVIAGGIDLTTSFEYEIDYGVTDVITMPYTISTGIEGEIILHLTIDGIQYEVPSHNGYNQYVISDLGLGLGTHNVSMYSTVDKYTSNTISFNLVIVSTTELYLSSTFEDGSKHTYGVPISVNYRLSKKTTETYNVSLFIDNTLNKTQSLQVGSYYWTLPTLEVGVHTLKIKVVSLDGLEERELNLSLEIEKGIYVPIEDYTYGLLCDLNARGRNNQDSSGDTWIDSSGNNNNAKLIGFNFATNGFINDQLICDNDAYVEIPWSPWSDNAPNGSTIDLIYSPINSGIEECRVIDYTFPIDGVSDSSVKLFKGIFADVIQTISSSASSGSTPGKVSLNDECKEIHLTWVLDRENKFMKTYIDGVMSRIMFLTDSTNGQNKYLEDFSHLNSIFLNSEKGLNCGTNNIKRFRVYNHALTSDQVVQNHIANIIDLEEQERLYTFNFKNTTLPKMYLNGDITNMTPTQTVAMRIKYSSPNEEKFGSSFETGIQNNPVRIQGTSSLNYARHNYTIFLKDEFGAEMLYNPYGVGSKAENVFCLKADYIDSSHCNNTGLAKFVNDNVYTTKMPPQLQDENCRTTINGFPIELYMNGEYLGIYNFNHDRYSIKSYGYEMNPNTLVYEISSNTNTSAGAFYRYGEDADSSKGLTEREYYAQSFKLIYGNRTEGNDSYSEIMELVEWVSIAEQDLFKDTITEHFNKEYLFRYLLTVLLVGGVDSLGKNCKLTSFDGKVWYFTFYDMDTTLGIDNSGYLRIEPDVEIEEGSYNTANSNLWKKVMEYFDAELKEEWALMRQGNFTIEKIMEYLYDQQIGAIPSRHYNIDAEVKYLPYNSLYTSMCHGSKEHLVKRWLRERIAYVDSKLSYRGDSTDTVLVRAEHLGDIEVEVTTYIPLYFTIKWKNDVYETKKIKKGETIRFTTYNSATDQEIVLYHAKHIKRIDKLSSFKPSSCKMGYATKLTELEIHSDKLKEVSVEANTYLRRLDLEGCSTLGSITATQSSLDLKNCNYLKYVNIYNTKLTNISFNSKGGSLREVYYPQTIQSVILNKQSLLEIVGLPYGDSGIEIPKGLYNVDIKDCPSISRMNTSLVSNVNTSLASMVYCNTLTLRNSMDLKKLSFDGFTRLENVTVQNMNSLENLGIDDLAQIGTPSTIKYIEVSNCPKLKVLTMNCSSEFYQVTFADNSILNLSGSTSLVEIRSNCNIKGLKTIVLPKSIQNLFFSLEYNSGASDILNLWSSEVCTVTTEGSVTSAIHSKQHEGIDFKGLGIKNIDLTGVSKIMDAINFNITPTNVNPNLNTNRDGSVEKPWFRPQGILNLTEYEGNIKTLLRGLDLDKITLVLPQGNFDDTDISRLFEATIFKDPTLVNSLIARYPRANNLDYILANSDITDASGIILPSVRFSMKGAFMNSKLRSDLDIPTYVSNVSECFKGCKDMTSIHSNWNKTYPKIEHTDCYLDCLAINRIDERVGKLDEVPLDWGGYGFSIGSTGTYTVVIPNDNYTLELGTPLNDGTTTWGDGEYSRNINSHTYSKAGIYTIKGKVMINPIGEPPHSTVAATLKSISELPSEVKNFNYMCAGCRNLTNINLVKTDTSKIASLKGTFTECDGLLVSPEIDYTSATEISEIYLGCNNMTTVRFRNLAKDVTSLTDALNGCDKLVTLKFEGKTNKNSAKRIVGMMNTLISNETPSTIAKLEERVEWLETLIYSLKK